jgi:hypothetical protein
MFFAVQFILVFSERAISHMVIQAAVHQSFFFQEIAIQPAIGADLVDSKSPVSLSISLNLLRLQEKMLPYDHGVEILPKYPNSRYADRDLSFHGGGARHNK